MWVHFHYKNIFLYIRENKYAMPKKAIKTSGIKYQLLRKKTYDFSENPITNLAKSLYKTITIAVSTPVIEPNTNAGNIKFVK